ncbi:MAG: hypothetical protein EOM68_00670, partial [Spirochaetia bacterium]|nr:hypothetical protein [Spirochaetia bacterium]
AMVGLLLFLIILVAAFNIVSSLVMLVTAEDGTVLEFTVGEDLWRWCAAGRLGGKSAFSIVRSPEGIDFKWDIFSDENSVWGLYAIICH